MREDPLYRKPVPRMPGRTSEERLRNLVCWVAEECPGRCLTLVEIGNSVGVTRERIRQIEAAALRKCQHPSRRKMLEE